MGDYFTYNGPFVGSAAGETMTSGFKNDYLDGKGGNDSLYGNDGDDALAGGTGNDLLDGGDGYDFAYYIDSVTRVTVDLMAGTATGEGSDTLVSIEGVVGSQHGDTIIGDDNVNILDGTWGDDDISGGGGGDWIVVGAGDLVIDGGDGYDALSFLGAAEEGDTVGVTFDLGAAQDSLDPVAFSHGTIRTTSIEYVGGTILDDILIGDAGENWLIGNDGDDILVGGAGNDFLVGDGELYYSIFFDEVTVRYDVNYGGAGGDVLIGGEGNDTLRSGRGDDFLFGGDGDDYLDGGNQNDFFAGGAGGDYFWDTHPYSAESFDVLSYADEDGFVAVRLDDDLNTASSDGQLWGNAIGNQIVGNIEVIIATDFDDSLHGNQIANIFYGGAGNDDLRGLAGGDTLFGEAGMDILKGGSGKDALAGGADADILRGNGGADRLDGGDDNDELYGGGGSDVISGGANRDIISGGGAGDTLLGEKGNDQIFGDGGNDWLDGGLGDDGLTGGSGDDIFFFASGSGDDTILDLEAGDTIAFDAAMGLDFEDLVIDVSGDSAVISWGTDDSITVFGDDAATLDEGDFWFGAEAQGGAVIEPIALVDAMVADAAAALAAATAAST